MTQATRSRRWFGGEFAADVVFLLVFRQKCTKKLGFPPKRHAPMSFFRLFAGGGFLVKTTTKGLLENGAVSSPMVSNRLGT